MSSSAATVVVVVDGSGAQANLSRLLRAALAARRLTLVTRTQRELVDEVSVEQSVGGDPVITPDRPLLWLSPGDRRAGDAADDHFLAFETSTAARSIAMLTRSPVLNRPRSAQGCGLFPGRASAAMRGARGAAPDSVRPERFTSDADAEAAEEVYDYGRTAAGYGIRPDAVGPYRCRDAVRGATTIAAVLVGERVVAGGPLPADLQGPMQRIAEGYALDLAAFWWLLAPAGPVLAKVDCWVYDRTLQVSRIPTEPLAGALADWLAERLPQPAAVAS